MTNTPVVDSEVKSELKEIGQVLNYAKKKTYASEVGYLYRVRSYKKVNQAGLRIGHDPFLGHGHEAKSRGHCDVCLAVLCVLPLLLLITEYRSGVVEVLCSHCSVYKEKTIDSGGVCYVYN